MSSSEKLCMRSLTECYIEFYYLLCHHSGVRECHYPPIIPWSRGFEKHPHARPGAKRSFTLPPTGLSL